MSEYVLTIILTNFTTYLHAICNFTDIKNPPSGGLCSADIKKRVTLFHIITSASYQRAITLAAAGPRGLS